MRPTLHLIVCGNLNGPGADRNSAWDFQEASKRGGNMNQHTKILMSRFIKLVLLVIVLVLAAPFWLRSGREGEFKVEANPAWSRKYNAKCVLCHTTYPRLNRTGYEFKR